VAAIFAAMIVGTRTYIAFAGYGPNGVVHVAAAAVGLFATIFTVLGARRYAFARLTPVRFVVSLVGTVATYLALGLLATPRESERARGPVEPRGVLAAVATDGAPAQGW
jgi:hypothetical protein